MPQKVRTPEEVRAKIQELQKTLVLDRAQTTRTIKCQIKILYWQLGELGDEDLD